MAGKASLALTMAIIFVQLFCGKACRSSLWSVYMPADIFRAADLKNNKVRIQSLANPGWYGKVCHGHYVRYWQVQGRQPPAWYEGPPPALGTVRQRHVIQYKFQLDYDTKYGTMAINVDVERCRDAGFHTGQFFNGNRTCFSDCEEKNVKGAYCQYACNPGYRLVGNATVTCQGSRWSSSLPPFCREISCGVPQSIAGTKFTCPEGDTLNKKCYVSCRQGYQLTGNSYTVCLSNGKWSNVGQPCTDVEPPTFVTDCVPFVEEFAAPVGQDTVVNWIPARAQDNSGESPTITYRLPGSREQSSDSWAVFERGTHYVVVFATDGSNNTETCVFTVRIIVVTCDNPKQELNITHMIYRPAPSGPQPHGTVLSLTCDRGHVQQGARQIRCEIVPNTGNQQARWSWEGDTVDMRPTCLVQPCPLLTPPKNGALTCFPSSVGTDCLMSCNDRYDIPPNIKHAGGRFTCYNYNPTFWLPAKVADCTVLVRPGHVYVHQDLFYYTGSCNNSMDYLKQSFVDRLTNDSALKAICSTGCVPDNIQVFCGQSKGSVRNFRSADSPFVRISFDVVMENYNDTTPEALEEFNKKLNTVLRAAITGNGSLVFDGLTTDEHSVADGQLGCQCPSGRICSEDLACVGCSKGFYMPVGDTECYECPVNTYQENDGSTSCVACPAGTFTESTGSHNVSQCQEPPAGEWGDWGMWTECSLSCGGGQQRRHRACDNPAPAPGGRDCQGPDNETRACGLPHCPVDGDWSQWSAMSDCSVTCGGGETTRTRLCDSPTAQHGGLPCVGTDREAYPCNNFTCPVNGGWSHWTEWSQCSATCGGGTWFRDRSCDSPEPSSGGHNCTGAATESGSCNDFLCPECPIFEKPQNAREPEITVNGDEKNVTVECLTGFAWAMNYQPSLYCGPMTNYSWSMEPLVSAPFEPPFCSEMEAASGGSGDFSVPMNSTCLDDEAVLANLRQQLDTSLATLPCKHVPNVTIQCTTAVLLTCGTPAAKEETTGNATHAVSRRRREAGGSEKLIVNVNLSGNIGNNTNIKPGTAAYDEYMAVMRATEESIRMILQDANRLFTIQINGQIVQPDVDHIFANGRYQCSRGSAMRDGFCLKCAAGTYEEESQCVFCPLGQYQDQTGQTSCKPCPPGTSWDSVGAYRLDQCTHAYAEEPTRPDWPKTAGSESTLSIGVVAGVSVAAVVVAIAVTAAVLYKLKRLKLKKVNSSLLSLNRVHPDKESSG